MQDIKMRYVTLLVLNLIKKTPKTTTSPMLPQSLIDYQRDKFTFEVRVMKIVLFQKLLLTYQRHCSACILL